MPIYEYRCDDCGHELEALQKIADAPLTDCPECDQSKLKKLISAVGFRLAGSGWYETDFKTGDKKKNLAGEAKSEQAESKGDAKSDGKSDGNKAADKSQQKSTTKQGAAKAEAKPAKKQAPTNPAS